MLGPLQVRAVVLYDQNVQELGVHERGIQQLDTTSGLPLYIDDDGSDTTDAFNANGNLRTPLIERVQAGTLRVLSGLPSGATAVANQVFDASGALYATFAQLVTTNDNGNLALSAQPVYIDVLGQKTFLQASLVDDEEEGEDRILSALTAGTLSPQTLSTALGTQSLFSSGFGFLGGAGGLTVLLTASEAGVAATPESTVIARSASIASILSNRGLVPSEEGSVTVGGFTFDAQRNAPSIVEAGGTEVGQKVYRDELGQKTLNRVAPDGSINDSSFDFLKGDIVEDLVQQKGVQQFGVQVYAKPLFDPNTNLPLWIGSDGGNTVDPNETGIRAWERADPGDPDAQPLWLDPDGIPSFAGDVATTLFNSLTVEVQGPETGGIWGLRFTDAAGLDVEVTVNTASTTTAISAIADALAAAVNDDTTPEGAILAAANIIAVSDGAGGLSFSRLDGVAFSVEATNNTALGEGGDPTSRVEVIDFFDNDAGVNAAPLVAGDVWTLLLSNDGVVLDTATVTLDGSPTIDEVVAGFTLTDGSEFSLQAHPNDSDKLVVARLNGTDDFGTTLVIDSFGSTAGAAASAVTVTLAEPDTAADLFLLTVDGIEFSARASDAVEDPDAGVLADQAALALVAAINAYTPDTADYIATVDATDLDEIIIVRLGAASVTASIDLQPDGTPVTLLGASTANIVSLAGPLRDGDTWTLFLTESIGGAALGSVNFTVTDDGSLSLADVAAGLAANNAVADFTINAAGDSLIIARGDSASFRVSLVVSDYGVVANLVVAAQTITLDDPEASGHEFVLDLNGEQFRGRPADSPTAGSFAARAAEALAEAIDADDGFVAVADPAAPGTVTAVALGTATLTAEVDLEAADLAVTAASVSTSALEVARPAGEVWVLILGDEQFVYTTAENDSLGTIATELRILVNASSSFSTSASGANGFNVTGLAGSFNVSLRIDGGDGPLGSIFITGTPVLETVSTGVTEPETITGDNLLPFIDFERFAAETLEPVFLDEAFNLTFEDTGKPRFENDFDNGDLLYIDNTGFRVNELLPLVVADGIFLGSSRADFLVYEGSGLAEFNEINVQISGDGVNWFTLSAFNTSERVLGDEVAREFGHIRGYDLDQLLFNSAYQGASSAVRATLVDADTGRFAAAFIRITSVANVGSYGGFDLDAIGILEGSRGGSNIFYPSTIWTPGDPTPNDLLSRALSRPDNTVLDLRGESITFAAVVPALIPVNRTELVDFVRTEDVVQFFEDGDDRIIIDYGTVDGAIDGTLSEFDLVVDDTTASSVGQVVQFHQGTVTDTAEFAFGAGAGQVINASATPIAADQISVVIIPLTEFTFFGRNVNIPSDRGGVALEQGVDYTLNLSGDTITGITLTNALSSLSKVVLTYAIEQKFYFGGEQVFDVVIDDQGDGEFTVTLVPATYSGGEVIYDVFSGDQVFDRFGNPVFHEAGDARLHFRGEPVLSLRAEIERFLGGQVDEELQPTGEPRFDENGNVVLNFDSSLFVATAGTAKIHDRRDLAFDGFAFATPEVSRTDASVAADLIELEAAVPLVLFIADRTDASRSGTLLSSDPGAGRLATFGPLDDLVSVTVRSDVGTFQIDLADVVFDSVARTLTITPDASYDVGNFTRATGDIGPVIIEAVFAVQDFRDAGDVVRYFGDEDVQAGQPVLDGGELTTVILDSGQEVVVTYTSISGDSGIELGTRVFFNDNQGERILHGRGDPVYQRISEGTDPEDFEIADFALQVYAGPGVADGIDNDGDGITDELTESNAGAALPFGVPTLRLGNEAVRHFGGELIYLAADDVVSEFEAFQRIDLSNQTGGIFFTRTESVEVILGSADDSFTVVSTRAGTSTTIRSGAGNDVIEVTGFDATRPSLAIFGDVDIDTGAGIDQVSLGTLGSGVHDDPAATGTADRIFATVTVDGGVETITGSPSEDATVAGTTLTDSTASFPTAIGDAAVIETVTARIVNITDAATVSVERQRHHRLADGLRSRASSPTRISSWSSTGSLTMPATPRCTGCC